MSYDLKFFRIDNDLDPARIYSDFVKREESGEEDAAPTSSADKLQMRRIATALKHWRPALQEFVSHEPLTWIEMDDSSLQVQFIIHGDHVDVTAPYFSDQPRQIMDAVLGAADVVREVAHYSAFDPQLRRIVTPADVDHMVEAYSRVRRSGMLDMLQQQESEHRPWWRVWH